MADRVFLLAVAKLREEYPIYLGILLEYKDFQEEYKTELNSRKNENLDEEFSFNLLFKKNQIVFAAILLFNDKLNTLEVISFGVGTKFLNTDDDDKVKDMHAEALSQKGLVKYFEENSLSESESLHMYVSSAPYGNSGKTNLW